LPFLRFCLALVTGAILVATATQASAFTSILLDWQQRYGATSPSGDNAGCQLCHLDATGGGDPWNGYGWDIGGALIDPDCDLNLSGNVTNEEAFFCVELLDSDGQGDDNVTEIGLGTQPGWTEGPFNTLYFRSGQTLEGQLPPDANAIGPLDPTGSEPPPPPPPPPPGDDEDDLPPGQLKRNTIVVKPGQSIQAAIDRAEEGTRIYVLAGVYRETGNPTNGLNITKNGIRLIGQKTRKKRVILENAGNQRNGIVVVPPAEKDCMGCHSDMAPPFPLLPGVGFAASGTTGSSPSASTATRSSTSSPSTTGTTGSSRPCRETGSSATATPRARTWTAGSGCRAPRTPWSRTTSPKAT
jgi:hypothetical protein